VETTGVYPSRDRILEVAVIQLDQEGRMHDEYTTLINPGRDVGPVDLHRITASDVVHAPRFDEVAGNILGRIAGTVWIGHNIRFDATFLRSEYQRLGHELPIAQSVCTLHLSKTLTPRLQCHRLPHCCAHFGIVLDDAHCALADARATAKLFSTLVDLNPGLLEGLDPSPDVLDWPRIPSSSRACTREEAQRLKVAEQGSYIKSLLERLPTATADAKVMAYMDLLDRVLEDRKVTAEEADALCKVALEWDISRKVADGAHREYLNNLVRVALADEVITDSEMRDLRQVTNLLGFDEHILMKIIEAVRSKNENKISESIPSPSKEKDLSGRSICFTGAISDTINGQPITRQMAEMLATNAGMIVAKGVTRGLEILVLADPESESTKARKAREYGTRLITPAVFWRRIGVAVD
jgi:DNA polymerase-3 subunit epsilon